MKLLIIIIIIILIPIQCFAGWTYNAPTKLLTSSGSETMAGLYAADVLNGWGVVANSSVLANTYVVSAGIKINAGSTWTDSDLCIIFDTPAVVATPYYWNLVAGTTTNLTDCVLRFKDLTASSSWFIVNAGVATFTRCYIRMQKNGTTKLVNYGNIYSAEVVYEDCLVRFAGMQHQNTDVTYKGNNSFLGNATNVTNNVLHWAGTLATVDDIVTTTDAKNTIIENVYYVYATGANQATDIVHPDINLSGATYLSYVSAGDTIYFDDLIFETITNHTIVSTGKLYVRWTYDPFHYDSVGNALNGATVELDNVTNSYSDTTGADGLIVGSIIVEEGYYTDSCLAIQDSDAYVLVVDPASGSTLTTTIDIQESWKSGYVSVQGINAITAPIMTTYHGSAGDIITPFVPSTTGATITIDIDLDDGTSIINDAAMAEIKTGIYAYEWDSSGRSDGENFVATCTDATNGQSYYYNIELRASGGLTGDQALQLTSIDNDTVNVNLIKIQVNKMNFNPDGGILTDTDEIALEATNLNIKTQTDKMNFNPSGEILTDTDEIALETTVTTYANYKADVTLLALESTVGAYVNYKADVSGLATTAALTDIDTDVNLILGSTEIMFHYLIGNQQINALGYHQFFKVDSSVLNKRYQLLDVDGNITTSTLNAYGREDNTP